MKKNLINLFCAIILERHFHTTHDFTVIIYIINTRCTRYVKWIIYSDNHFSTIFISIQKFCIYTKKITVFRHSTRNVSKIRKENSEWRILALLRLLYLGSLSSLLFEKKLEIDWWILWNNIYRYTYVLINIYLLYVI